MRATPSGPADPGGLLGESVRVAGRLYMVGDERIEARGPYPDLTFAQLERAALAGVVEAGVEAKRGEGPLAHVNFRLGTLHPDDQATVHDTLHQLAAKYPEAAKEIRTVTASWLTTRWGSFRNDGQMRFSNVGGKFPEYRNPDLAATVAHEFGHALVQHLAGGSRPKPPKDRPSEIADYNDHVRGLRRSKHEVVRGMYEPVRQQHGDDSNSLYRGIKDEFSDQAHYITGQPEELLVHAFAHHEVGRPGPIASAVGPAFEEAYARRNPREQVA